MPTAEDFRAELLTKFEEAQKRGAASLDVNSGELHESVGGYPGKNHRMPVCCEVMYQEYRAGDKILSQPPKGKGAGLTIKYELPR